MTARLIPRPIQRAGHIGYRDNRFCGEGVFTDLAHRIVEPIELLALAFGIPRLDAPDREVLRLMSLSLTSPDARVWPLKLARTLASYGSPYAGFFGAQLGNDSDRMGPGTASNGAASLAWILERAGADPTPEAVAAATAERVARFGRIAGFGVPFRDEDERRVALLRLIDGHPATRRPAWRLHLQVADALRTDRLAPNIVLSLSALLLDLGLAPHRAGMFLSMIMVHNFAAHALEAADHDGAHLRELPANVIEDRSAPPRRSPAADAAAAG